jgi:hypothetical protein
METMKRFFYNPDKNKLYLFDCSHVEYYHNQQSNLKQPFDFFIRGMIANDTLYLRLYYPYNDIEEKSFTQVKQFSFDCLNTCKADILKELQKENIDIKETIFNVSNDDLKTFLNLQYV